MTRIPTAAPSPSLSGYATQERTLVAQHRKDGHCRPVRNVASHRVGRAPELRPGLGDLGARFALSTCLLPQGGWAGGERDAT